MTTTSPARKSRVNISSCGRPWKVLVCVPATGQQEYLGYFDDAELAAKAYDKRARQLGIKALNFSRHGTDETQAYYHIMRRTKRERGSRAHAAPPPPLAAAAAVSDGVDTPVTAGAQQQPAATSSGGAAVTAASSQEPDAAATPVAPSSLNQAAGGGGDAAWVEAFLRAS
jgi:hypothetical protein